MDYIFQHDKRDFRDLLPVLDRSIFKNPCIPAKIWKSLGDAFDLKQWTRVLRKHRVSIALGHEGFAIITASFDDETNLITMEISRPKLFKLGALKFELLQAMMHEMIHANQFFAHDDQYGRILGKPKDEEQEYLSNFGELQAFAHCIAMEFRQLGWGAGNTISRYDEAEYMVKRELLKQIVRWTRKYENGVTKY